MELNERDRILLGKLQHNARITHAELADAIGLSTSGVQKRLKKLEETGFIAKYATLLNRKALGYQMLCFIEVILRTHGRNDVANFDNIVQQLPQILECHRLTGSTDYLLKVIVRDREYLDQFLTNVLMPLPMVERLHTRVVLKEIKETTDIDTL